MSRVLTATVLVLSAAMLGATPAICAAQQSASAMASESQPSPYNDAEAGRRLLDMANLERAKAGLPPLQVDDGLAKAARAHADAMAAQQKLSHQLSGEPNLEQRLAANTKTHLDESGENVAFAGSVEQAHSSLMHSPPHRANLLNADYNVAGFSVVRSGALLYIAQDFGHSSPNYSRREAEDLVAASVDDVRAQRGLPELRLLNEKEAATVACSMAKADSLDVPAPHSRVILRYTTAQPQTLPRNATRVIENRSITSFAAGSCYARTSSYPTGTYWVALLFY